MCVTLSVRLSVWGLVVCVVCGAYATDITQKDKNRIYRMTKYTILGLFWSVTHSLCAHIFFFVFFLCFTTGAFDEFKTSLVSSNRLVLTLQLVLNKKLRSTSKNEPPPAGLKPLV